MVKLAPFGAVGVPCSRPDRGEPGRLKDARNEVGSETSAEIFFCDRTLTAQNVNRNGKEDMRIEAEDVRRYPGTHSSQSGAEGSIALLPFRPIRPLQHPARSPKALVTTDASILKISGLPSDETRLLMED